MKHLKANIFSEIGKLNGVILHTPGHEVENMIPENAERALYSDILNLNTAKKEYKQLNALLSELTNTFQAKELLSDILKNNDVKTELINFICKNENIVELTDYLCSLNHEELSTKLIEGVVMVKDNLSKFLDKERYSLRPLHNFFFTRDASSTIYNKVLINKMASNVRDRESLIMEAIFKHHPLLHSETVNLARYENSDSKATIEGGDILVAREDILLIGNGDRTTTQGIDQVIEYIKKQKVKRHIIIQELPYEPESFIHLDMAFTFLDNDKCMVYEPLILKTNRFLTIHIQIDNGKVISIKEKKSIPSALKELGMDMEPIYCGGKKDSYIQDREQWHSGANFFALAPGKVIGYGRNIYTIEEMNNNGFEVIKAKDVISKKINLNNYEKYVITMEGGELARGGGGCRCMTMPVSRSKI
ncbi:MAG: arginine deiminase family protein [Bacteroidota bacterium]|nr:arginine deiminase family protein [Bacteroidota bacterium]